MNGFHKKRYLAKMGDYNFPVNESGPIIQEPGFDFFFTSVCLFRNATVQRWRMRTLLHCLPKISLLDIPRSTSVVAAQRTCPVALR